MIERNNLESRLAQKVIAMISSNLGRRGHPSRVFLSVDSAEARRAGLRLDSIIMTDNMATVLENEIVAVLGRPPQMQNVNAALKHTLDV